MRPEVWGPPIWTLFHVLAENINEEQFSNLIGPLFSYIKNICKFLPCPECSEHATSTLSSIRMDQIDTKDKFRVSLFIFHNSVNRKKNKQLFNIKDIGVYGRMNLLNVWKRFIAVYNTKGNMQMLTESFQRELIMKEFRKWFGTNITCFLRPRTIPSVPNAEQKEETEQKEELEVVEPEEQNKTLVEKVEDLVEDLVEEKVETNEII
jgi:hypothetical protein